MRFIKSIKTSLFLTFAFLVFFVSFSSFVFAAKISVPNSPGTLSNNLVGYWTFDGRNVINGVARDLSGNNNNGNLINIATSTFYTAGKIGQGFNFDGVDDAVTAPLNLSGTDKISVSFWMKWNQFANDDDFAFEHTTNGNSVAGGWFIDPNYSGGNFLVKTNTNGSGDYSRGYFTRPTAGVWHHYVIIIDKSVTLNQFTNAYVDGSSQTITQLGDNNSPVGNFVNSTLYFMSRNKNSLFGAGALDDVRIYSRALSATEIKQLYSLGGSKLASSQTGNAGTLGDSSLVGYWTFDGKDVVNGVAKDLSGNNNNGNLISIATSTFYAAGKIGQGFRFDGVDDYVNLGDSSTLSFGNGTTDTPYTFSAWVKFSDVTGANSIIYKYGSETEYAFGLGSNNLFSFVRDNSESLGYRGRYVASAPNYISNNKWAHIVAVYDSGGLNSSTKIYINSVQRDSNDFGNGTYVAMENTSEPLHIGRDGNFTGTYFNGSMDDVRIYSRALSATEVKQLYNSGGSKLASSQTGNAGTLGDSSLVGYWTFDGKNVVNGVARDLSGNNNNGNLINISTSTFYTAGKIGQGFKFDGVNDYVVGMVNPLSAYPFTENIWIKAPTQSGSYTAISYANTGSNVIYYTVGVNGNVPTQKIYASLRSSVSDETGFFGTSVLNPGRWYMVTLVMNSATDQKIYLNGVLDGTNSVSIPFVAGNNIAVGVGNRSSQFGFWPGTLDDARFYNRALSVTEIKQLYNMGN